MDNTKERIRFDYDAMGHRIAKHVGTTNTGNSNPATNFILESTTYYVLDAQGNTLSVYERNVNGIAATIKYEQAEKHIYGSSRLGVMNVAVNLLGTAGTSPYSQTNWTHKIGQRTYELSNHLGNVLSVISDKVIPHPSGGSVAYYKADILQSQDYSPFGVTLKGRNLKKTGIFDLLRYGFNGMEKDDEVKGDGNSYTTEFRQYDPRLGRWLSIDPLYQKFPWQSPYVAFDNKPICMNDPKGLSAQNGGEKKWSKGDKGSRKKDNGNGTTTYDAPGHTEVTIPSRAEILGTMQDYDEDGMIDYNNKQLEASKGDLYQFKVDNVIYTAKFSNGNFSGYFNSKGKEYSSVSPVNIPVISPVTPPNSVNAPTELYWEVNAEKNNGRGLGGNVMGYKVQVYIGQETQDGYNYNSEDGYNKTGINGTKDMGKRYGIGIGGPVPYIGEAGAEISYTTYKNGKNSLTLAVNLAFVGRIEMDFLQGDLFYGLQGQVGIIAPWVGYDASAKIGQKVDLY